MKLLINTTPLQTELTGVGVYTLNVVKSLIKISFAYDFLFYYGHGFASKTFRHESRLTLHKHLNYLNKMFKRVPLGRRALMRFVNSFRLKDIDVYFEPNFIPILDIKARFIVTTVHDFSFFYRDWVPESRFEYFKTNFFTRINKSDFIITPSAFIRQEVLEKLNYNPQQVFAIYHGIDQSIFCETSSNHSCTEPKPVMLKKEHNVLSNLPERFILFVGALQPRKNLSNLIQAYQSLGQEIKDYCKLVLVGFESWNKDEITRAISSVKDYVFIYDKVFSNEHLAMIYRKASALVFPSFYEGFGFPPVEAMACGCPVLVSNTSSLPEVCGDAALYVDPKDIGSIASGIQRILTDENIRKAMRLRGLERARLFTWEKSALEHLKVFESLIQ
jgi:glycosyltransferase involved in cell wall biosynthesis